MTLVGYARVSSIGQSLGVQLEKLKGCEKVFKEKRSGVDTGRPALKQCLEFLRDGDTLLVSKIDRLARSTSDPRRARASRCWMILRSTPDPAPVNSSWASLL